jgi:hypothetical protein
VEVSIENNRSLRHLGYVTFTAESDGRVRSDSTSEDRYFGLYFQFGKSVLDSHRSADKGSSILS